ncbi:hypothetical protein [Conexibacter sp. SYSU D00693]|uniref:hypothetical protein n=1 Tax=Conexibacter sp. SYSU D00693 TaxID=2812560 RepID=UPI00196A2FB5|nr:hypothetical protein [Conexibacter sp. SYSU D00693]
MDVGGPTHPQVSLEDLFAQAEPVLLAPAVERDERVAVERVDQAPASFDDLELVPVRDLLPPPAAVRPPVPIEELFRAAEATPHTPRFAGVRRWVHVGLLAAGLVVGLLLALPLRDVAELCPPSGEGRGYCAMQKQWAPAVITTLAPMLAAHLVAVLALETLPGLRRRRKAGERPVRRTRAQRAAPYEEDPVLLAASWGVRAGHEGR